MSRKTLEQKATSIRTRFLILSDTHSASPMQKTDSSDVVSQRPLPKADVVLHCGDLTNIGHLDDYEKTINMLGSIDAGLKLVIAGNHDITLDEAYYARKGPSMHQRTGYDKDLPTKAKELWLGHRARSAGITYLEEGTHSFTLGNGAKLCVYASPYQPEFCDWAFPYFRNQDRYNPPDQCTPNAVPIAENPVPDFPAVDVMMTHGPPMGILDATTRGEHVGCQHLLRAARRCKPVLHCFGHIHEAWGAQKVKWKGDEEMNVKTEEHGGYQHLLRTAREFFGGPQKEKGNEGKELDVKIEEHVEKSEEIQFSMNPDRSAVTLDISKEGEAEIKRGQETLMVNASIMTVRYKPWNSPWLVDLDLEKAE